MANKKSATTVDEFWGEGTLEERGKRPIWCTREAMDFDSKMTPLCSIKEIFEYLSKNDVELPDEITVEWYP